METVSLLQKNRDFGWARQRPKEARRASGKTRFFKKAKSGQPEYATKKTFFITKSKKHRASVATNPKKTSCLRAFVATNQKNFEP
ncbi:MAG: hypothetical protein EOO50_01270 [Flavobacterium sp.]|uniref:hypothetical protein n=1 Tax=Flavobacterium sp. TaxID=239 RepID=UPI0011F8B062|nr:hypothetical protein [Flavobacterium sp.]RZJ68451.1 MAG: hypothetical protein EOO50_01270 [Flavobacterium sp.]